MDPDPPEEFPPEAAGAQQLSFTPHGGDNCQYLVRTYAVFQFGLGITHQGVGSGCYLTDPVKDILSAVPAVEDHVSFFQGKLDL